MEKRGNTEDVTSYLRFNYSLAANSRNYVEILGHNASSTLLFGLVVCTLKQRAGDYQISCGSVARCRHIIQNSDSEKRLDIYVVRKRFQRIPEKNQVVQFFVSNQRPDFHVSTMRTVLEQRDG